MQCSQKLILFNVFLFLPHFSFYCFYFSLSPLLSNWLYCCVYCLSYLLFRPLFPFKYINNKLQTLCIAYDYNNYDCYYYYFIFSSLTVIIVWNDFEWIMQISLSLWLNVFRFAIFKFTFYNYTKKFIILLLHRDKRNNVCRWKVEETWCFNHKVKEVLL